MSSPVSLNKCIKGVRCSSTLDQSKQFAGKNMFDGTEHTSWNSEGGKSHTVLIRFKDEKLVDLNQINITFQGGFCPHQLIFEVEKDAASSSSSSSSNDKEELFGAENAGEYKEEQGKSGGRFFKAATFHPEDTNSTQHFSVEATKVKALKVHFVGSSDTYGRIIVYRIDLFGQQ